MTQSNALNIKGVGIVGNTGLTFNNTPVTQFSVLAGGVTPSTLFNITNGTTGQVLTANTGNYPTFQNPAVSVDLHTARFIVSSGGSANGANYTTIASAYAAAVAAGAPQTVFIQDGTYTENLTLASGIDITSFDCDELYGTPNVIISGKLSATFNGAVSLSGLALQTNSDYCLEITGSNPTNIILSNCQVRATNHNAIHMSSSGTPGISLFNCNANSYGNFNFFTTDQGGGVNVITSTIGKVSGSVVSDTFNAVSLLVANSIYGNSITMSGSCGFTYNNSAGSLASDTLLTLNNTGSSNVSNSRIESGTASAISIGTGATAVVAECQVLSNNTNAITGLGTLNYGHITFTGTSSTVNTSTQNALPVLPASGGSTTSGFSSYASATLSNVTGNGVIYNVIFNSTTRNDGTAYNTGTGVFTAPTTGLYSFSTILFLQSGSAFSAGSEVLVSSLGNVESQILCLYGAAASAQANAAMIVSGAWMVQMTAGDTMQVQAFSNSALQDVSIAGGAVSPNPLNAASTFSGFLVH